MIEHWVIRLRGGAWDGDEVVMDQRGFPEPDEGPPQHCYLYKCKERCAGHMQFDLSQCPVHSVVVVYNREECSEEARTALYVYGDLAPDDDLAPDEEIHAERELVGAGVGWQDDDDDLRRWEGERLGGLD